MSPPNPQDPSVFEDADGREISLTEEDLLGTHQFQDVLYTGEPDIIDITTEETPPDLDRDVERAKKFAEETTSDGKPPRVAKALKGEQAVETRTPYVSTTIFHLSITGSIKWALGFHNAWKSDAYDVTFEADYDSGDLSITVTKST